MGLPPVSALASIVLWLSSMVTLVVSLVRRELFWPGLVVMAIAVVVSCLEGVCWYVYDVVSCWFKYKQAKVSMSPEELEWRRQDWKEASGYFMIVPLCALICLIAAPCAFFGFIEDCLSGAGRAIGRLFKM